MSPANAAAHQPIKWRKVDHAHHSAPAQYIFQNCTSHTLFTHNTLLELYCTSQHAPTQHTHKSHITHYYRTTQTHTHTKTLLHRARAQ